VKDAPLGPWWEGKYLGQSQWGFMSQFLAHPYFGNSAEEFHPHETLSTPIKLLSSLSLSIQCHVSIFNAHEILMKPRLRGHSYTSREKGQIKDWN